jgi:putative transposase
MPAKYRRKTYQTEGVYHIYSKGINEMRIFRDENDYGNFMDTLARYLLPYQERTDSRYKTERPYIRRHRQMMNLTEEVKLLGFNLMPDHFHLVIWQKDSEGMTKFMRRILTNYVMYYNFKYKRRGNLFEGVYRAIFVPKDQRLLVLLKYLHLEVSTRLVRRYGLIETSNGPPPEYYLYSSYQDYLGMRKTGLVTMDIPNKLKSEFPAEAEKYDRDLVKDLILE